MVVQIRKKNSAGLSSMGVFVVSVYLFVTISLDII